MHQRPSIISTPAAQENSSSAADAIVNAGVGSEFTATELARLKEKVSQGDNTEFNDLCRTLLPRLWRQALSLCGNATQAEDLVQETLVAAWRAFPRFGGRCRFFTWLCAILLNRHRNVARRIGLFTLAGLGEHDAGGATETLQKTADPASTPDQAIEEAERNEHLRQALDALPHRQREVIYLRFYAGESLDGIAAVLGCSTGTVKSRLFHGLERLRKMKVIRKTITPAEAKVFP